MKKGLFSGSVDQSAVAILEQRLGAEDGKWL